MSYWVVTTDQSLPALTANGLSVIRSTVVPTVRTTGSSAALDSCACANGPAAARATIATAAASRSSASGSDVPVPSSILPSIGGRAASVRSST